MSKPNIFPVVVVLRGQSGVPYVGQGLERTEHVIDPEHRTTIRFVDGEFALWVINADETEQVLAVQLAHARIVGLIETGVIVEGMEVIDFQMTGRAAQVVLTNADAGWIA